MADTDSPVVDLQSLLDLDASYQHLLEQARFLANDSNPLNDRLVLAPIFVVNLGKNPFTRDNPQFQINPNSLGNVKEVSVILDHLQALSLETAPETETPPEETETPLVKEGTSVVPPQTPAEVSSPAPPLQVSKYLESQKQVIEDWNQLNLYVIPLVKQAIIDSGNQHLLPSDTAIVQSLHSLPFDLSGTNKLDVPTLVQYLSWQFQQSPSSPVRLAVQVANREPSPPFPKKPVDDQVRPPPETITPPQTNAVASREATVFSTNLQRQFEQSPELNQTLSQINALDTSYPTAVDNIAHPYRPLINQVLSETDPARLAVSITALSQAVPDPKLAESFTEMATRAENGLPNPNLAPLLQSLDRSALVIDLGKSLPQEAARLLEDRVINAGALGLHLEPQAMHQYLVESAKTLNLPEVMPSPQTVASAVILAKSYYAHPMGDNPPPISDQISQQAEHFLKSTLEYPPELIIGQAKKELVNRAIKEALKLIPANEQTELLKLLNSGQLPREQLLNNLLEEFPQFTKTPKNLFSRLTSSSPKPSGSGNFLTQTRSFFSNSFRSFKSFFNSGNLRSVFSNLGTSFKTGFTNFGSTLTRAFSGLTKSLGGAIKSLGGSLGGLLKSVGGKALSGLGSLAAKAAATLGASSLGAGLTAAFPYVAGAAVVIAVVLLLYFGLFSHTSPQGLARTQMQTLGRGGTEDPNGYASLICQPGEPDCPALTCPNCTKPVTCGSVSQCPGDNFSHDNLNAIDFGMNGCADSQMGVYYTLPYQGTVQTVVMNYCPNMGTGYGNYIDIVFTDPDSGRQFLVRYAHLDPSCTGCPISTSDCSPVVSSGQTVNANDLIAFADHTGFSTAPHLHFELRALDGGPVPSIANFIPNSGCK